MQPTFRFTNHLLPANHPAAGAIVRKLQNGAIPTYALSILLGVVAVLLYFLFVA